MAILPFENDTNRFELTQEIHQELLKELPRALGVTNAGEDAADAVVQGMKAPRWYYQDTHWLDPKRGGQ